MSRFDMHTASGYVPASALIKQGVKTVTMEFHSLCHYRMQDNKVIEFKPGIQEVPADIAKSAWVRAHAKEYTGAIEKPFVRLTELSEHQTAFLKSRGYSIEPDAVLRFLAQLTDDEMKGFVKDAEAWKPTSGTPFAPSEDQTKVKPATTSVPQNADQGGAPDANASKTPLESELESTDDEEEDEEEEEEEPESDASEEQQKSDDSQNQQQQRSTRSRGRNRR